MVFASLEKVKRLFTTPSGRKGLPPKKGVDIDRNPHFQVDDSGPKSTCLSLRIRQENPCVKA